MKRSIIVLLVATTIWAVLVHFIPWNWLSTAVHLSLSVFTAFIVVQISRNLKLSGVRGLFAWSTALLYWFLLVVIYRSLLFSLLDSI